MVRKIIGILLLGLWVITVTITGVSAREFSGDNSSFTDSSISIDLGEGNGAIIITGNNNTIYVPDMTTTGGKCEIVKVVQQQDGFFVLMPETEISYGVLKAKFKRIILFIANDGFTTVVYAEQ